MTFAAMAGMAKPMSKKNAQRRNDYDQAQADGRQRAPEFHG